jgi:Holliday junction DNA helicase RuvA
VAGPVQEALVGLGWSAKQAGDAVERVAEQAPADAEIAALLRLALRELRP